MGIREARVTVFLQFNGPFSVTSSKELFTPPTIGYTFEILGGKEGREREGVAVIKKVGSFERVRFDSAVKRESMRGRNCSETETTVDETRFFERCNCKKRVNNDF